MYEYTYVEIPMKRNQKVQKSDNIDECMKVINDYAKDGWRLVQVLTPPPQRTGEYVYQKLTEQYVYQIIFEKEKNEE